MKFEKKGRFKQLDYLSVLEKTVETIHLQLRQPTREDFTVLGDLWRDKKVRQFLGGIISNEEIKAKIDAIQDHWNQHGFRQFTVCTKNTKQIMGICGLHYSEDGIEISYMFFPAFWGKGFATESVLASLYYGFNFLKLEKIMAITQDANQNSWGLLEKVGMSYIKTISQFESAQRVYMLTQSKWFSSL